MTQVLEELLNAKEDWQLAISERLQLAIDQEKQMTELIDKILDSLLPYYTVEEQNAHSDEILECWYKLENAIDKRLVHQIVSESQSAKSE